MICIGRCPKSVSLPVDDVSNDAFYGMYDDVLPVLKFQQFLLPLRGTGCKQLGQHPRSLPSCSPFATGSWFKKPGDKP